MKLSSAAIATLQNSQISEIDGSQYLLTIPPIQLSTKVFGEVKNTCNALRGTWSRQERGFVFPFDPTLEINAAIAEKESPKRNPFSLFSTPPESVDFMLDNMISIQPSSYPYRFLEPSAGDGRIAQAILQRWPNATVDCVEIDPFNRQRLTELGLRVVGDDFLRYNPDEGYNFVAMNPPFQGVAYQTHIQKAYSLLRQDYPSELISVLPSGFRRDSQFSNWLFSRGCKAGYIGSVFEGTVVECEIIKINTISQAHNWQPYNGYPSFYACDIILSLESDFKFYQLREKREEKGLTIADIRAGINRLIGEGLNLYSNSTIEQQVLTEFNRPPKQDPPKPTKPKTIQLASSQRSARRAEASFR